MLRSCTSILASVALACSSPPGSDMEAPPQGQGPPGSLRLVEVASGLTRPLHLISPTGDPRLFIVEQPGRIRIVKDGQLLAAPFLDIASKVRSTGNEQGLLSVAFHPAFAQNGYFYVNYTDLAGDTRVERYRVGSDPDLADPASALEILSVDQPFGNHNGGHVLFGPDGMLYVAMGDGGSGGDPQGHGQNRNTLLGAILRLDVSVEPYRVPPDNPFVGQAGMRPEIWLYGVRNPWRIHFDATDGMLYVADVGQNQWEEVHVVPAGQGGLNLGWNRMEGRHCFPPNATCATDGLQLPQVEYDRSGGCSITGGLVYRGAAIPGLRGHYFYGDYCNGWVRSFRLAGGAVTEERQWELGGIGQIMSFGQDAAGELYVMSMNGRVYRFVSE